MRCDSSVFTSRCRLVDISAYETVTAIVGTEYFEWRIPLELIILTGVTVSFDLIKSTKYRAIISIFFPLSLGPLLASCDHSLLLVLFASHKSSFRADAGLLCATRVAGHAPSSSYLDTAFLELLFVVLA